MRRFTRLFLEMDRTTRTNEKIGAMEQYFREAPPQDAAWGLFFLSGRKLKRLTTWRVLDEAIREETALPAWLIAACYEAVGDSAEMAALLVPHQPVDDLDEPLSQVVADRLLPLGSIADPSAKASLIRESWRRMSRDQRLVFNKLLTGGFRVGVAHTSLVKALAQAAGVPQTVMAHRFAGAFEPTAERLAQLMRSVSDAPDQSGRSSDASQPYPFMLGYPLESPVETLGDISQWQIEWKYDGFRAQVIHRDNHRPIIWSRGEELITDGFPEIVAAAQSLPIGTVLDGEIAAWESADAAPLPFALLQRRINRKTVEPSLFPDVPVAFIAFDVLEDQGVDVRGQALASRRTRLEHLMTALPSDAQRTMFASPLTHAARWNDVARLRMQSRQRRVEGVMIKRRDSVYEVGRRKGDWWKWKIDPYTIDAVLIYAQGGSGRRSGLFTDYTFGVWDESVQPRELVPIAKAYSGLTDEEIKRVDHFIRTNTLTKAGPVRIVKPELVFELAFEGIAESDRHRSRIALRFPRMHRWRTDKTPDQANTLESLRMLLAAHLRPQRD